MLSPVRVINESVVHWTEVLCRWPAASKQEVSVEQRSSTQPGWNTSTVAQESWLRMQDGNRYGL